VLEKANDMPQEVVVTYRLEIIDEKYLSLDYFFN
jgi:hypothetical protein